MASSGSGCISSGAMNEAFITRTLSPGYIETDGILHQLRNSIQLFRSAFAGHGLALGVQAALSLTTTATERR